MQTSQSSNETQSLYGIVRRHCRERLLVEPLRWTKRHLEVLRCSFSESFAPAPELLLNTVYTCDGTKHLKRFFGFMPGFARRETSVRQLIASRDCPLTSL
ncbi:hypothetical protein V8C42DRAFT_336089 [Trichoderma barbatum]